VIQEAIHLGAPPVRNRFCLVVEDRGLAAILNLGGKSVSHRVGRAGNALRYFDPTLFPATLGIHPNAKSLSNRKIVNCAEKASAFSPMSFESPPYTVGPSDRPDSDATAQTKLSDVPAILDRPPPAFRPNSPKTRRPVLVLSYAGERQARTALNPSGSPPGHFRKSPPPNARPPRRSFHRY